MAPGYSVQNFGSYTAPGKSVKVIVISRIGTTGRCLRQAVDNAAFTGIEIPFGSIGVPINPFV
jgi:hypothetical protein